MTCIADANVLFPLLVQGHVAHEVARGWWDEQPDGTVGTCLLTRLAVPRLLTNRVAMNGAQRLRRTKLSRLGGSLQMTRVPFTSRPSQSPTNPALSQSYPRRICGPTRSSPRWHCRWITRSRRSIGGSSHFGASNCASSLCRTGESAQLPRRSAPTEAKVGGSSPSAPTDLDASVAGAADRLPLAVRGREPHAPGETQAEVLVLREALEVIGDGLQDVGCAPAARNRWMTAGLSSMLRGLRVGGSAAAIASARAQSSALSTSTNSLQRNMYGRDALENNGIPALTAARLAQ